MFWIVVAIIAIGMGVSLVAGYRFGYKAADAEWREAMSDKIEDAIRIKMEEVKQLYAETYRNVLVGVLDIYEDLKQNRKSNK